MTNTFAARRGIAPSQSSEELTTPASMSLQMSAAPVENKSQCVLTPAESGGMSMHIALPYGVVFCIHERNFEILAHILGPSDLQSALLRLLITPVNLPPQISGSPPYNRSQWLTLERVTQLIRRAMAAKVIQPNYNKI
uniref:Uncharacterized protein n=1 Tax=Glossina pallidipes TaxID=7398 RepID=A0A1A9Z7V1_GLOPL